ARLLPVVAGELFGVVGVACGVGFRRSVFVGHASRSCLSCKLGNDDPQQTSRQRDGVGRWSIFERVLGFAQKVSAPLEDVGWFWRPRAFCCLKLLAFGKLGNDDLFPV
uniref:Uncharacterized protein n=1 Tax=Oryza meridionalis TaxID=40149 RepID=A0A0E0CVI6_9ORYZ